MTFAQLYTELWEDLGEPNNLDPATAAGLARLGQWINRAYKKIMFWKFADGSQVRFPAVEGLTYFQMPLYTDTITTATTTTVDLPSTFGSSDDQYNGYVIDTDEGRALITDYTGASRQATVAPVFLTAPTGDFTMYKAFMRLCKAADVGASENIIMSPVSSFAGIRKITDMQSGLDLSPALRTDSFGIFLLNPGVPLQYMQRAYDIVFDYPCADERFYRMEYTRIPPDMTLTTDEPELPENYHDAILLWALWRAYRWTHEFSAAYSTKRDLMDFMASTRSPLDMEGERENAGVEVNF